jgi:hypothetical protein
MTARSSPWPSGADIAWDQEHAAAATIPWALFSLRQNELLQFCFEEDAAALCAGGGAGLRIRGCSELAQGIDSHSDASVRELGRLWRRSMRSSLRKSNRISSGRSAFAVLPTTCRSVSPTLPRKTTFANCGYFRKRDIAIASGRSGLSV